MTEMSNSANTLSDALKSRLRASADNLRRIWHLYDNPKCGECEIVVADLEGAADAIAELEAHIEFLEGDMRNA